MKNFKLQKSQPAFDVVDGPMAGRKFTHEQLYAEAQIPKADLHKFTEHKPVVSSKTKGAKS